MESKLHNEGVSQATDLNCKFYQRHGGVSVTGTALGVVVLAEGSADLRAYCRLWPVLDLTASTQKHWEPGGRWVGLGRLPIVQPLVGTPLPGATKKYL